MITLSIASLFALVISSCAPTTPAARIKKSPTVFEQLSPTDQELAKQGKIKEGMEKNAVLIALGQPTKVSTGSKDGASFEKWYYADSRSTYSSSTSFGHGGFGHRGFGHKGFGRRGFGRFGHRGFSHSGIGSFGHGRLGFGRFGGFGHSVLSVRSLSAVVEFDSSGKVTNWSQNK